MPDLAVQMKEFLSGIIYWYDAALESLVTSSGHVFWFMPLLTAVVYCFRCSSNKKPQAKEETVILATAQNQSKTSPLLKRVSNQNITCEKENQHPEGQQKVAAMKSHARGCDLLVVWWQQDGQEHFKPRRRLLRTNQKENEKRLCVHAQEGLCSHWLRYICYTEGSVPPLRHLWWCRRVQTLATQGLDHILFVHVQNNPLKQTYRFISGSSYTWVLCKPFSFYVLSTWKMLSWAAMFDKQTPQWLLHTSSLAQMVSGSDPKVGLYMAFSSWRGFSLPLCCTATAH